MKRILISLVTILLSGVITGNVYGEETNKANFSDVKQSHWAYNEIMSAVQKGYFKGYQDGTFKPTAPVSREEFAVLLSRVSTNQAGTSTTSFADINGKWSEEGILDAINKGFINQSTYATGFKPTHALTRIEMAKWLSAGLSKANPDYEQAIQDMADTVVPVAEFYKGGLDTTENGVVALNIATGLMNGYTDGSFGLGNNTSRAEVAAILLRYEEAQKKDPTTIQVLNEFREVGLTGTNVESLGFVVQTQQDYLKEFKDFRKISGTLNNSLGYANLNRLIIVDQFKTDHPYYKMFIGKNFDPNTIFNQNGSFVSFRELIVIPKSDKLHGGTYNTAFKDTNAGGSGFESNSSASYGLTALPTMLKFEPTFFKKDTSKTYWSYSFTEREYKGSNFDAVRVTFNGKTFWALAPGADAK